MSEKKAYLEFCEKNFGREVDEIIKWNSSNESLPNVSALVWKDYPEKGLMTAVTYGLSLMRKDEWVKGMPELMIRLETENTNWALAMAYFVDLYREEKVFKYLTVLSMDEKISEESEMRGFMTFGPPLIDGEEMSFERDGDVPINLIGFYPLYLGEIDLLCEEGFDAIWNHELYDPFSINRKDISQL